MKKLSFLFSLLLFGFVVEVFAQQMIKLSTHPYYNTSPTNFFTGIETFNVLFLEEFPDPIFNTGNWPAMEGTPEIVSVSGAPSAPYALYISAENSEEVLISRIFDLSGLSSLVVAFYESQLDLETPEGVAVEYYADNGTWQLLHEYLGSNNITPFELRSFPLPSDAYHTGFKFRFKAIGAPYTTPGFEGWYFDSIYLGAPTTTPIMTVNPQTFSDTLFVGERLDHRVYISNSQADPSILNYTTSVDNSATWLSVNGNGGQVGSSAQDTLIITVDAGGLAIGSYSGYVEIAGDDPANLQDSVQISLEVIEAPQAAITPMYSNPVVVNEDDSVDVQIQIANTGLSNLEWSLTATTQPLPTDTVGEPDKLPKIEGASAKSKISSVLVSEATWNLQLNFPLSGAAYSGAEFDGNAFYVTEYITGSVEKYDMAGNLINTFNIPGTVGLRQIDFDGTFMYGVGSGSDLYEMNFITQTLVSSIATPLSTLRSIAYDSEFDAFWISGYDTDILLLDKSGNILATIPSTSHNLTNIYGSAYDNRSAGGPYLWVVDRSIGNGADIIQFDLATGSLTGVTYDVLTDFPGLSAGGAGLFISEGIVPGSVSIGGGLRGLDGMLYAYELAPSAPPWINILTPTSGVVQPGDQVDMNIRIYGNPAGLDTTYFVFNTNDPANQTVQLALIRNSLPVGIKDPEHISMTFSLSQNYPNPFNPATTIEFSIPKSDFVTLKIYNILGQEVATLLEAYEPAGQHAVNFNASKLTSGIYYYTLTAGDFKETRKMVLLR